MFNDLKNRLTIIQQSFNNRSTTL